MNILLLDTSNYSPEFSYCNEKYIVFSRKYVNLRNADSIVFKLYNEFKIVHSSLKKIDFVSVSNGPGSFTGLRVGLSIAKSICMTAGSGLILLNSLDVLANKLSIENKLLITPVIPANTRNEEYYYADYTAEGGTIVRQSEYNISRLTELKDRFLVTDASISSETEMKILNVGNKSNAEAQYKLTKREIKAGHETDFKTAEPYYLKNFTPIKN